MSQPGGQPGGNNTPEGKETRLAKLLKSRRDRELSVLSGRVFPLIREIRMSEFFGKNEWAEFFNKFGDILKALLKLDALNNDQALKIECQEVLPFIEKKDTTQARKYKSVIFKLFDWFDKNKISMPSTLP